MRWILIRHGKTRGNLEKRYIGCRTDEPLCPEGIGQLRQGQYPAAGRVFASPMRRCLETAGILYPGVPLEIVRDLRECDFGTFEGKNYAELNGREDYQAWIDSGGTLPFPGGESLEAFSGRCVAAFEELKKRALQEDCALVVHGGTIMAIMAAWTKEEYFNFQADNGKGYILEADGSWSALG